MPYPFNLKGYFDTPQSAPMGSTCGRILIPDDPIIRAAIGQVLAWLAEPDVWNDEGGGQSPIDTASEMSKSLLSFTMRANCMLGVIVPFATANVPDGMLLCDGGVYNAADYPALWSIISPALQISGTQFKTPDLRGRFVMADGDANHPEHSIGGEYQHALVQSEMPYHQHLIDPHTHTNEPHYHTLVPGYTFNLDLEAPGAPDIFGAGVTVTKDTSPATVTINPTGYLSANGVGGDTPHENTPPYYVLRYAMVARFA